MKEKKKMNKERVIAISSFLFGLLLLAGSLVMRFFLLNNVDYMNWLKKPSVYIAMVVIAVAITLVRDLISWHNKKK